MIKGKKQKAETKANYQSELNKNQAKMDRLGKCRQSTPKYRCERILGAIEFSHPSLQWDSRRVLAPIDHILGSTLTFFQINA